MSTEEKKPEEQKREEHKFERILGQFSENLEHVLKIFILSPSDGGKTNLLKFIIYTLRQFPAFMDCEVRYLVAPSNKTSVITMLKPTDSNNSKNKNCIIALDDASFILQGREREIMVFQNLEARVRHIVVPENAKIVIIYAAHYEKSVSPFLRHSKLLLIPTLDKVDYNNFARNYKGNDLGIFFRKGKLIFFNQLSDARWTATPEKPIVSFSQGDDKVVFNALLMRPALIGWHGESFITMIPNMKGFNFPYWNPPSIDETLEQVEAKFGHEYRRELEQVLLEGDISQDKVKKAAMFG